MPGIGTAIRTARLALGWSLDRLAREACITARGLWNIENGKGHPREDTLEKLAAALGKTLAQLYGREDKP